MMAPICPMLVQPNPAVIVTPPRHGPSAYLNLKSLSGPNASSKPTRKGENALAVAGATHKLKADPQTRVE